MYEAVFALQILRVVQKHVFIGMFFGYDFELTFGSLRSTLCVHCSGHQVLKGFKY
jgi:hypothetical protein